MQETHFHFPSNAPDARVHAVRWLPDGGEIRGVVQLVHGMSEHIERYRGFAEYLTQHGFVVVGHDHLGHGGSVKSDDELGYFAAKDGSRMLVRDMHRLYTITKKDYDEVPYVMLGHSMGSFLTRLYLCCYGTGLDGAVICGTGWQPEAVLRSALAVCLIESRLFGWKQRSRLIDKLAFGTFNMKFRPNRTASDWLSRNEQNVDAYVADPHCGFLFTVNGFYNLFLTIFKVQQKEYLEHMKRDLPVLFIAGAEDPVGDFGKGVRRAEQAFRETGMRDVECRLYADDRHELLNEVDQEQVYEDVLGWMEQHVMKK